MKMRRPVLNPAGFFRRIPLEPHQLLERQTRTEDTIVLCHLGVPWLDDDQWSLRVDGLVRRPREFSLAELRKLPKSEIASVHQCAGNPLQPAVPTRRICNVTWGGVRLADLIGELEPMESARFLWSYGADYGSFDGVEINQYLKDLPIERIGTDVLIAYEMNGQPLRREQGFPARLVVPGFYGTNSVKWITRITVADRRADGPFTTLWYNDPIVDDAGGDTGRKQPVWSIASESVIVSPGPEMVVPVGEELEIWGWAWADRDVAELEVSTNGGGDWMTADLESRSARSWQKFSLTWRPGNRGKHTLCSRAKTSEGDWQPMSGSRNAVHHVVINVV